MLCNPIQETRKGETKRCIEIMATGFTLPWCFDVFRAMLVPCELIAAQRTILD